jgi:hypothetical protein
MQSYYLVDVHLENSFHLNIYESVKMVASALIFDKASK